MRLSSSACNQRDTLSTFERVQVNIATSHEGLHHPSKTKRQEQVD